MDPLRVGLTAAGAIVGIILGVSILETTGTAGDGTFFELVLLSIVGAFEGSLLGFLSAITGGMIGALVTVLFTFIPIWLVPPGSPIPELIITTIVIPIFVMTFPH